MNALKMCLNWKVIAALAVVAGGIALTAPGLLVAALPLLFLAACPLSMLLMMRGMGGGRTMGDTAPGRTADGAGAETLADLKARVARVQAEQQSLSASVAQMERRTQTEPDAAPLTVAR